MRLTGVGLAIASAASIGRAAAQDANFGGADGDPNAIRGFHMTYGASLQETLTDNVNGTAGGGTGNANAVGTVTGNGNSKQGDLVTTITPTVSLFDVTRQLQFGAVLSPSYEKFAATPSLDRFNNNLTATGQANGWENRVNVQSTATVSRQLINSQGAITTGGISSNTNQTTVSTYTLTPTYKARFGDFAGGQLQYQFGYTSNSATAPTTQNQISAGLTSGDDFGRLQWSVQLQDTETNQGNQSNPGQTVDNVVNPTTTGNLSQRTGKVGVNYALTRFVTLLSSFGYEQIHDSTLANNLNDPTGSFGIQFTGTRLNLTLNYNFQYGSQFLSAQGSWDVTPRIKAQLSYGESIQTQQSQAIQQASNIGFNSSGNFTNTQTGQQFSANPASGGVNNGLGNSAFLDKNGQFTVTGAYDLSSWSLSIQTDQESSAQANFNQSTLNVTAGYNRPLSEATTFNTTLGYFNTSQTGQTATSSNTYNIATGLTYDLGQGVTTSATYSFLYRKSSQAGEDIRENAVTFVLSKMF